MVLVPFLGHLYNNIPSEEWKFELLPIGKAVYPPLTNQYDSGAYALIISYLISQDIPLYFEESDLLPFKKCCILAEKW